MSPAERAWLKAEVNYRRRRQRSMDTKIMNSFPSTRELQITGALLWQKERYEQLERLAGY